MYLLAIGILTCRNAFKEVVFEEIGLYPSSELLGLQTHRKSVLVKFFIKVSKVITTVAYKQLRACTGEYLIILEKRCSSPPK
jgi:hypothetical protein